MERLNCDERMLTLLRALNASPSNPKASCFHAQNVFVFAREMMEVAEHCGGERNPDLTELGRKYAKHLNKRVPGLAQKLREGTQQGNDQERHATQSVIVHHYYYSEMTLKRSLSWPAWLKALAGGI